MTQQVLPNIPPFVCPDGQTNGQTVRLYYAQNFIWGHKKMKNFPIDPIVKIARFRQLYNVAESWQFLQWWWRSMGKFFTRNWIWMKFGTRVRLKCWNDRGEFELDRAKSKNIAENSVALGYEKHNRKHAFRDVIQTCIVLIGNICLKMKIFKNKITIFCRFSFLQDFFFRNGGKYIIYYLIWK